MDLGNENKMYLGNKNKMDGIESKLVPISSFQSYLRTVPDDSVLINKVSRPADTQLTGDSNKKRRGDDGDDGDDGDGGVKSGGGKPRSSRKRASKTRNIRRKTTKRQSRHRRRTSRK